MYPVDLLKVCLDSITVTCFAERRRQASSLNPFSANPRPKKIWLAVPMLTRIGFLIDTNASAQPVRWRIVHWHCQCDYHNLSCRGLANPLEGCLERCRRCWYEFPWPPAYIARIRSH